MQNTVKARIYLADGKVINLELYPDVAPITVNNFVALCKARFYDGLCFHRIIDKFMIQGGGLIDDSTGGMRRLVPHDAPRTIKGEFRSNGVVNPLRHEAGVISMARTSVKDSASSQFFICVANAFFLDGEYAAFGRCADKESLETAVALGKVRTGRLGPYDDVPQTPVIIKTIEVL